jgi:FAD/FMN-containing dehydrogenase
VADKKEELGKLVGKNNIFDDAGTLESYSRDNSFAQPMKPQLVVKPADANTVQRIVEWANRTKTPLIPVSSGPPHFHGDTVPGVPGAVVLDLSSMKKIMKINRRNRLAIIETGVTYSELQPALAKEGMQLSTSLLPRANKSVVTSLLEREPRMNCRYQWSSLDPLRALEIIWGDGNKLWSGGAGGYLSLGTSEVVDFEKQWSSDKWPVDPAGPAQTDFYRFLSAAQGSTGIATWASVRCEVLPGFQKLFLVPAKKAEDLFDLTYRMLRFRYADEIFIMNSANLAYVLGEDSGQVEKLSDKLPKWVLIFTIAGRAELPAERVEFLEKDIKEIISQFGLELKTDVAGADGSKLLKIINSVSREPYWKLGYKGNCQDIFFITTLDKTPDFIKTMFSIAETLKYPASNIGVYLQPRHQGSNCHCEFNLPYTPDQRNISLVKELYTKASDALINQGAFFSRPYGIWADMAFRRDPQSTKLLQKIKSTFDPNGVMNPGKLCF